MSSTVFANCKKSWAFGSHLYRWQRWSEYVLHETWFQFLPKNVLVPHILNYPISGFDINLPKSKHRCNIFKLMHALLLKHNVHHEQFSSDFSFPQSLIGVIGVVKNVSSKCNFSFYPNLGWIFKSLPNSMYQIIFQLLVHATWKSAKVFLLQIATTQLLLQNPFKKLAVLFQCMHQYKPPQNWR